MDFNDLSTKAVIIGGEEFYVSPIGHKLYESVMELVKDSKEWFNAVPVETAVLLWEAIDHPVEAEKLIFDNVDTINMDLVLGGDYQGIFKCSENMELYKLLWEKKKIPSITYGTIQGLFGKMYDLEFFKAYLEEPIETLDGPVVDWILAIGSLLIEGRTIKGHLEINELLLDKYKTSDKDQQFAVLNIILMGILRPENAEQFRTIIMDIKECVPEALPLIADCVCLYMNLLEDDTNLVANLKTLLEKFKFNIYDMKLSAARFQIMLTNKTALGLSDIDLLKTVLNNHELIIYLEVIRAKISIEELPNLLTPKHMDFIKFFSEINKTIRKEAIIISMVSDETLAAVYWKTNDVVWCNYESISLEDYLEREEIKRALACTKYELSEGVFDAMMIQKFVIQIMEFKKVAHTPISK